MATITKTVEFGQYPLQVRPAPVRVRSTKRPEGIVLAPPPSREPSLQSSDQYSEKIDTGLPPVDRGIGAWKFLFAAFMIEGFIFGFPINYGVFQSYYSTHPPYAGNNNLSTIGTFGTCFYYLGAPIATYLVRRYQRWQQWAIYIGFTISIIGLFAAGSAKDFGSLVATQGLAFGIGILIMYYPIFNLLNEWFIERRGLALGVICASTGITGLFYPFVLEVLLNRYGPATTLRVSAIALLLLCGMSSTIGALLLVVYSFAQILGQMAFGYVSDLRIKRFWMNERVPVEILVFISPFISAVSILALWGPARSLAMLIAFVIFYGASSGGFAVLWARMSTTLNENPALALTTFSYFACMKGIGNVVTGPISSALLSSQISRDEYGIGKFKGIVAFSGAAMLGSAAVMVFWGIGKRVIRCMRRKGEFCGCPA
ncbi:MAG: hypothetical protein Q9225_000958 [Loekoesia sp. 1 TL-2023]